MANDLNLCQFIGRLGADPETRFTPSGLAVCNIRIACGWKSKDKEGAEWVSVTAFGKLAEIMGQYLKKGSQVYIAGRMTTEQYEKDGVKKYSTKIVADQMQMLDSRGSSNSAPSAAPTQDDGFDDDIPF